MLISISLARLAGEYDNMADKLNFKFRRKEAKVPKEQKTKWPELIGKVK
jgi:hypothetical protein